MILSEIIDCPLANVVVKGIVDTLWAFVLLGNNFAYKPRLDPHQGSIIPALVKEGGDAEPSGGDRCPSMQPPHALLMCHGDVEAAELGGGHADDRWDSHICGGCKCFPTGRLL